MTDEEVAAADKAHVRPAPGDLSGDEEGRNGRHEAGDARRRCLAAGWLRKRPCAPRSSSRSTSSCSTWPSNFTLHPTVQRTLPKRRDAINNGGIDWGHAEALAFASLLTEGVSVRITGQDAERGTFSHRQAVLHDVDTGDVYTPLAKLPQARGAIRDL